MSKALLKIDHYDNPFVFSLSKHTFDLVWAKVFAKNQTVYAYDERDRVWDNICVEHQKG